MALDKKLLSRIKSLHGVEGSQVKALALKKLGKDILAESKQILTANKKDLSGLPSKTASAFRDRLALDPKRIEQMVISLNQVADLSDPVGEIVEERTLGNGLKLKKVRAPLGVIFMIFESRPNVILEAFSLAFMSGNSIILRGGSESAATAKVIYKIIKTSLKTSGIEGECFVGIEDYDRKIVSELLKQKNMIDVVVPRGGEKLIEFVQKNSLMPIIKNDRGLCHTYIDESAQLKMAVDIVVNAKTQRPGVCNALETVLVHQKVAGQFLPELYAATKKFNLQWRVDKASAAILKGFEHVKLANEKSWGTEYLDLIMNCRIVADVDDAILHIKKYGSKHSEAIVTESKSNALKFQNKVDAAAVYHNASTRFTDGFEFGLGGELGISTQKLHVRGPVGLRELTTPRWLIHGSGQIRK